MKKETLLSQPETLLTPEQTAKLLQVKTNTLKQWRWGNMGPSYVKVGRMVRYNQNNLNEYIARNTTNTKGFV